MELPAAKINRTGKSAIVVAFLSLIFYRVSLDLAYFFLAARLDDYARLTEINFGWMKFIESYILLFLLFVFLPKSRRKISSWIIWLTVLFSYVPMLTLFAFMDKDRLFTYAVFGFWIFVASLLKIFPLIKFKYLTKIQSQFILASLPWIFLPATIILIYFYVGFSINFNFSNVYSIRDKFQSVNIPLASYFFTWIAYVINPFLSIFYIKKRNWLMLLAVIVTQIVLFSATGNKTFIFTLPFIFFLIWVLRRGNPYAWIYFVFGAFCLAGIFSYWSVGDRWTYFIFARRTLLAPAQLAFFYRDFFSQNSLLYLSAHHFFSWITIYPYKLDPPNLIGTLYLNSPQTSANNGIYSDAFMNFGYWGFVIWAVVFSFIMKLIDSLSRKKDFALCLAAVSMLPIVFTNAALLTSIFTNGLLVALVMIYLAPVENEI